MGSKVDIDAQTFNGYLDICLQSRPHSIGRNKALLARHSKVFTVYMKNYHVYRMDDLYLLEQIKVKSVVLLKFLDPELLDHIDKVITKLKDEYRLSKTMLDQLPGDILKRIFTFLTVEGFTTLRLVNARWKRLTTEIPEILAVQINERPFFIQQLKSIYSLIGILKQCGHKVHNLDFRNAFKDGKSLNNRTFQQIATCCPNLLTLYLPSKPETILECVRPLRICPKLEMLHCGIIWIRNLVGRELRSCRNLTALHISTATSMGVSNLATLTKLTALNLEGCKDIYDFGVMPLSTLTNLTSLNLNNCPKLTDKSLQILLQNRNLQVLKLRYTQLTDKVLISMAKTQSPELHSLDLGFTNVTDNGLNSLILLPGLRILNVEGLTISNAVFNFLSQSTMNRPQIIT